MFVDTRRPQATLAETPRLQERHGLTSGWVVTGCVVQVLMQKVAKELLAAVAAGAYTLADPGVAAPAAGALSLEDPETLRRLFAAREARLVRQLQSRLERKTGAGGQPLFEVWMKQESDLVQAAATAFGERMVLERFYESVGPGSRLSAATRGVMQLLWALYGLRRVEVDLAWFLSEELLPPSGGRAVSEAVRGLVSVLAPHAMALVEAWGIPDHLLATPIAGDWTAYNAYDNQGELQGVSENMFRAKL